MSFATDSFTGAEGTELSAYSASWVKITSHSGNAEIAANRLRASSTTTAGYYHTGTPSSADYTVSCDLYYGAAGGTSAVGVLGRCSTSAATFYHVRHNTASGIQLYKVVNNTFTQLGSNVAQSVSVDTTYALQLRMEGSTISAYWAGSGTPAISQTDSAITAAGKAGVRFLSTTSPTDTNNWQITNFDAADLSSGLTISCTPGAATADGYAANVGLGLTIACSVGAADADGYLANAALGTAVACLAGAGVAAGYDATVELGSGLHISCTPAEGAASSYSANVGLGSVIVCQPAAADAAGYDAAIASGIPLATFGGGGGVGGGWSKSEWRRKRDLEVSIEQTLKSALAPEERVEVAKEVAGPAASAERIAEVAKTLTPERKPFRLSALRGSSASEDDDDEEFSAHLLLEEDYADLRLLLSKVREALRYI